LLIYDFRFLIFNSRSCAVCYRTRQSKITNL